MVDLLVRAWQAAGFEPIMGPPFTTDQDTLGAIGTGPPSWTVFYAAQAEITPTIRTVFRPFAEPVPAMPILLAVSPEHARTPAGRPDRSLPGAMSLSREPAGRPTAADHRPAGVRSWRSGAASAVVTTMTAVSTGTRPSAAGSEVTDASPPISGGPQT